MAGPKRVSPPKLGGSHKRPCLVRVPKWRLYHHPIHLTAPSIRGGHPAAPEPEPIFAVGQAGQPAGLLHDSREISEPVSGKEPKRSS